MEREEPPARARPRRAPARPRPSSLRLADERARPPARSHSVEGSARSGSPGLDLRARPSGSAERLVRLRDLVGARAPSRDRSPPRDEPASDDESAPLVSSPPSPALARPAGVECSSPRSAPASADFSPSSDVESPRGSAADFDLLPEGKGWGRAARARAGGGAGERDAEPYGLRLLARGTSEGLRSLWRQDALDSDPPWLEPDSAV